jgi:hypothetical protein
MNKLTVASVTYKYDLALTRRQLWSIYQYYPAEELEEIIIVWNGEPNQYQELLDMVAVTSCANFKVTCINAVDLIPGYNQWHNGWWSQQQIKVMLAEVVTTPWYLIVDAKDRFEAPAGYADFIEESGERCRLMQGPGRANDQSTPDSWLVPLTNPAHPWQIQFIDNYTSAYKLMGLDIHTQKTFLKCDWRSTVFPAHTQTMLDMIQYLRERFEGLFYEFWYFEKKQGQTRLFTEYALISAWHTRQGLMDTRYQPYVKNQNWNLFPFMAKWDKAVRGLPWQTITESIKEEKL